MQENLRSYVVYQVNSFTTTKFSGNPAGVVINAEGLTEREMLLIARELKNSETAFLFKPTADNDGYDVMIRFFTPTTEVPVCGHATIASHFVRVIEKQIHPGQKSLQKTKAGIFPIEISEVDGNVMVAMTQGEITFTDIEPIHQRQIIAALGLENSDLLSNCPLEIASTGHSKVIIGINSRDKLNSLKPNLSLLTMLSEVLNCNGYFVFTFDSPDPTIITYGRMFAPAIGIDEDPVTGNGNGPLGAYIVRHKLIEFTGDQFSFVAKQGEAMGRPGVMAVHVDILDGLPIKVSISGTAVIIYKTVIEF